MIPTGFWRVSKSTAAVVATPAANVGTPRSTCSAEHPTRIVAVTKRPAPEKGEARALDIGRNLIVTQCHALSEIKRRKGR
jgi:hypothetical protein